MSTLLEAVAMPHQKRGADLILKNGVAFLAWEPGVSKTATVLLALSRGRWKRTLVLAPLSVTSVWRDEVVKWEVPALVTVATGTKAKRLRSVVSARDYSGSENIVVVLNYEMMRAADFAKIIHAIPWDAIVLDETYKIQNPKSKLTRAILKLKAPVRVCLNGTPLSNSWLDIWAASEWLRPGCLYGSWYMFRARHAIMPIPNVPAIKGWRGVDEIKKRIAPFTDIVKKMDVLNDLPALTVQEIRFPLVAEEKRAYKEIKEELKVTLLDGEELEIPNILVQMGRLRQCVNGTFTETKSKLNALKELLTTLPGERVIIFSSYAETVRTYQEELMNAGIPTRAITGAIDQATREVLIQEWKDQGGVLFGTNAMQTGLNLQDAAYIIQVDRPWSLASEEQRIGRAWRKGQDRPVTVYNLTAEDTVDEYLGQILARKKKDADEFASISRADLVDLLA